MAASSPRPTFFIRCCRSFGINNKDSAAKSDVAAVALAYPQDDACLSPFCRNTSVLYVGRVETGGDVSGLLSGAEDVKESSGRIAKW